MIHERIEEGSVQEKGLASSTGGRRAQIYGLKPDLLHVVSVAIDQLITLLAIIDMHNNLVGGAKKIERVLPNHAKALEQLKEYIELFIHRPSMNIVSQTLPKIRK